MSKLFLGYSIFKFILVYFFQTGSVCLNLAQFFSNQINFFQPRSMCLNLDQFGAGEKHRSQATSQRLPIQEVS